MLIMKTSEINIRDPFILKFENKYYLYGTRAASAWGKMNGFDCYVGLDLENWEGPFEVFRKSDDFFADQNYWAPECYFFEGNFYLLATLGAENRKKGVHILKSENPLGPFSYVNQLTPKEQECIDGTIFQEGNRNYVVYSRTFQDCREGEMCAIELTEDFTSTIGNPIKLFSASCVNWTKPIPFAKAEFDIDGDVYLVDGPSIINDNNQLVMLWSSWAENGYSVGYAKAISGKVEGPWEQSENYIIENGGHGMIFTDLMGKLRYTYHFPNDFGKEKAQFISLENIF